MPYVVGWLTCFASVFFYFFHLWGTLAQVPGVGGGVEGPSICSVQAQLVLTREV